jgi:hypothetical protein
MSLMGKKTSKNKKVLLNPTWKNTTIKYLEFTTRKKKTSSLKLHTKI